MSELARLLRHAFAPLVALMVAEGYLPKYMQQDVTEFLVVGAAIAIPMIFSWWRDKKRKNV